MFSDIVVKVSLIIGLKVLKKISVKIPKTAKRLNFTVRSSNNKNKENSEK